MILQIEMWFIYDLWSISGFKVIVFIKWTVNLYVGHKNHSVSLHYIFLNDKNYRKFGTYHPHNRVIL